MFVDVNTVIADYFIIANGTNANQVQTLVDNVEEQLAKNDKSGINIPLPEGCIKSVILGERTTEQDKILIVSAIKKHEGSIKLKRG